MNFGQKQKLGKTVASLLGSALVASLAVTAQASSITVTDVTDWNTTPMEIVNANIPYLGYNGGVYAGINTLQVFDGTSTSIDSGFCVDPFHWSLSGPVAGYQSVPLIQGPKSPGTLNAATALQIEDLWAEYFSPTMSANSAAGLQIAIWELVSSNAIATDGLPSADAFQLEGDNDFGASRDIASLGSYAGPAANLTVLTGPGQDYVVAAPSSVPEGGATLLMLVLTAGALVLARARLIQKAGLQGKAEPIPVRRSESR